MEAVIGAGLNAFNDAAIGYADREAVGALARDPVTGAVLRGAIGRTSLGLLFLDLFYLPSEYRGAGLGSEILSRFEDEGRRRGCVAAVLYTISSRPPASTNAMDGAAWERSRVCRWAQAASSSPRPCREPPVPQRRSSYHA